MRKEKLSRQLYKAFPETMPTSKLIEVAGESEVRDVGNLLSTKNKYVRI